MNLAETPHLLSWEELVVAIARIWKVFSDRCPSFCSNALRSLNGNSTQLEKIAIEQTSGQEVMRVIEDHGLEWNNEGLPYENLDRALTRHTVAEISKD